jgi:hypothetical protein
LTPPPGPQPPGPPNQPPGSFNSPVERSGGNSGADGQDHSEQIGPAHSDALPPSAAPGPPAGAGEPERHPRPEPSERPWNTADIQQALARIDQLDPSSLEEQELALRLIRQLVEQHLRTLERRPEDGDAPGR